MSEGTYEYECMRAELLGIEKPSYDEFISKKMENDKHLVEDEDLDTENLKAIDHQEEGMKKVSGGLEELNNILQKTQGKLNRLKIKTQSPAQLDTRRLFRSAALAETSLTKSTASPSEDTNYASCGSLTNLLRIKMGGKSSVETPLESEFDPIDAAHIETPMNDYAHTDEATVDREAEKMSARKSDLAKALDRDLSRLDNMIEKAENAQYSMSHQRKQMNKFLD